MLRCLVNRYFRSSIRTLIILPKAEIICLLKKQVLKMIMQKKIPYPLFIQTIYIPLLKEESHTSAPQLDYTWDSIGFTQYTAPYVGRNN